MVIAGVLQGVRRFWLLGALGMACTVAAALMVVRAEGVYWAKAEVLFAVPSSPGTNALMDSHETIIATAGLIQRDVVGARDTSRVVSDSVTLVGQGVREGVSVRLPNSGGQWANNFERPVLDVQVVSESQEGAQRRLDRTISSINKALTQRQQQARVNSANLITMTVMPAAPEVQYVTGERYKAALVTFVLGTVLSLGLVRFLHRWQTTRGDRSL